MPETPSSIPLAAPFDFDADDDLETKEYEQQDSRPKSSRDPLEDKIPGKSSPEQSHIQALG